MTGCLHDAAEFGRCYWLPLQHIDIQMQINNRGFWQSPYSACGVGKSLRRRERLFPRTPKMPQDPENAPNQTSESLTVKTPAEEPRCCSTQASGVLSPLRSGSLDLSQGGSLSHVKSVSSSQLDWGLLFDGGALVQVHQRYFGPSHHRSWGTKMRTHDLHIQDSKMPFEAIDLFISGDHVSGYCCDVTSVSISPSLFLRLTASYLVTSTTETCCFPCLRLENSCP
ncbi:hypothetical protein B0J14DRAFT_364622 [Halenospora varia]|nr:hypothetical protein B0J14DRAFT_364622 [Halenospora varia]